MSNKSLKVNIDKGWKFVQDDVTDAYNQQFDDRGWEMLDVPHDWSIGGDFHHQHPSGTAGGFLPGGIGWYRKKLDVSHVKAGQRVHIHFDGVFHRSTVYLNGQEVGTRPNGYVSFIYDLTPFIDLNDENVIAVKVDNSDQPNCRWHSGSGIYRHVWLSVHDPLHIDHYGTSVTTPKVTADVAEVSVQTVIVNHSDSSRTYTLRTSVNQKQDEAAIEAREQEATILPGEKQTLTQRFLIHTPDLWSPEKPALYETVNEVMENGQSIEVQNTTFGIRSIRFSSTNGFFLNEQSMKLKGINLHHDAGCLGAAVPERALERRLQIAKEMGCNSVRCSHNIPAPEMLEMCDRMGFLVIDEAFDKWTGGGYGDDFNDWWERDLKAMLERDRNHPCIFLWSVGNEVENQGSPESVNILKMLVDYVHEFEPTRLVTCALRLPHEMSDHEGIIENILSMADQMDVLSLNYMEPWYDEFKARRPELVIIGSETFPHFRSKRDFFRAYDVKNPWFDVVENDYVVGQYLWTLFDYIGESPKWPSKGWASSIIDTCGFRKPTSYFHQSVWSDKPMVHIAIYNDAMPMPLEKTLWNWPKMCSHWNLPHLESHLARLVTFTNCEKVELWLNGNKFNEKWLSDYPDAMMTWYVPYVPGVIKAVGFQNGKPVSEHELKTAGEADQIVMEPDRTSITADGNDIVHVDVSIADRDGIVVPDADQLITFSIKGEGKIIGVDNGNLDSHERFKGNQRSAYRGKCLVIVQSTSQSGSIALIASASGVLSAKTTIQSNAVTSAQIGVSEHQYV
ncbi:glycoside hydrolase family 2 protein [Aureibacillus halotolerans]|uniref:Beta-galactosidase n=1 Tax=Aureibacillus halotolerans TaxID=1508390 RepID=A0A4R6UHJ6_9BACI|nr:glycoside hydrolase family 2 TIM barrel-domain containing protein [Aureibacillus halotolerans]TDQ42624.1 beta-galactosidase [Aureibacillus halotolerans]